MRTDKKSNPFGITKAVDLDNEQIERLWVKMSAEDDTTVTEFDHPASPMPTYILGAKGSGKTHMMRHQAFELQKLRYQAAGTRLADGISTDGYLGLYVRCSGLHSNRFSGKRQPAEVWNILFAFYFELWLAQHAIKLAIQIVPEANEANEASICAAIVSLLDKAPTQEITTLADLLLFLGRAQRDLDYQINNCLITGNLNPDIIVSPGNLIFGIPAILAENCKFLSKVLFVYSIDEFENLTDSQQVHVNTLYRERESPSTFRIGARTYGVHTYKTNSAGEENIQDSEYSTVALDAKFRELPKQYTPFCRALILKRLENRYGVGTCDDEQLDHAFEDFDPAWNSPDWRKVISISPEKRVHFVRLGQVISALPPVVTFDEVLQKFQRPQYPLLEKLNILLFYQDVANGKNLKSSLVEIDNRCSAFIMEKGAGYSTDYNHYRQDLCAQLIRENRLSQTFGGIRTFIRMSAGIPRALLTVLRSVYEWSAFADERPFEGGKISLKSQHKGVIDASDWYYSNMRKAGEDGLLIQQAVERLANVMRIHRFGDKPSESSLSSFSVSEKDLSGTALRVLRLAEARAFLHRVSGVQKERNSDDVTSKFQISPMLAPRWDLPMVRRGILPLSTADFNAIFDPSKSDEYSKLETSWRQRVTAGVRADSNAEVKHQQIGLFE